jgi:adenine-specific DNA-methyltransferase
MGYRYIGNKRRIMNWILSHVERLLPPGATVADPMCGTASVSAGLRSAGYRVVAGDIMTYAYHHAQVRLLLDQPPAFAGLALGTYRTVLTHLNALEPVEGLFWREYSPAGTPVEGCSPRKYFTPENAQRLDAIRKELSAWEEGAALTPTESALLRHDLVLAANRVANIAGTYGHYRSKWSASAEQALHLRPYEFDTGPTDGHRVLLGALEDLSPEIEADLCYLDPPYMKRQYAANYHILETLARGDEPTPIGVSGLRDWWDQYSNFCSKRNVRASFESVIRKMSCDEFLVSYSEDGLLHIDELVEFLETFGSVRVAALPHQRFRSNQSPLGSTVHEYLVRLSRAG